MKRIVLPLALVLLGFGSSLASPRFKELNNKNNKTTIQIEIPVSDFDESNGLKIDDVRLYNNGEMLKARTIDILRGETSTVILKFKKLTTFDDCTLSFTIDGKPVSMDIQSIMERK